MTSNNSGITNCAMQVECLRSSLDLEFLQSFYGAPSPQETRRRAQMIAGMAPCSLLRVWQVPTCNSERNQWFEDLCYPLRTRDLQPHQYYIVESNPLYSYTHRDATDPEVLYSDCCSSNCMTGGFLGVDEWVETVRRAGSSRMYCLCSRCESAVNSGLMPPHRRPQSNRRAPQSAILWD